MVFILVFFNVICIYLCKPVINNIPIPDDVRVVISFVLFYLFIVSYCLLRFMVSNYPVGIFKLFFQKINTKVYLLSSVSYCFANHSSFCLVKIVITYGTPPSTVKHFYSSLKIGVSVHKSKSGTCNGILNIPFTVYHDIYLIPDMNT